MDASVSRTISVPCLVALVILAALSTRAATPPRVLIVGPLDGYGALVAGVSQGLQAGGFPSAADISDIACA